MNSGVGVIITNNKRNSFYFQQKDEHFFIKKLRLNHTFFGGNIEDSENEFQSLKRELFEELEKENARKILRKSKKLFTKIVFPILGPLKGKPFQYHLFEARFNQKELDKISKGFVYEGKGGFIILKKDLKNVKFIPSMKIVLDEYLLIFS